MPSKEQAAGKRASVRSWLRDRGIFLLSVLFLLVFLGLLGTFWGLSETVGSVGKVIEGLKVGGDAGSLFDALKEVAE